MQNGSILAIEGDAGVFVVGIEDRKRIIGLRLAAKKLYPLAGASQPEQVETKQTSRTDLESS
jgi:hypothetical protein